jgi:ribosomal protein S27AE
LTINADELDNKYCPECFEVSGKKRYDFEEVEDSKIASTQHRCEDCGMVIACG